MRRFTLATACLLLAGGVTGITASAATATPPPDGRAYELVSPAQKSGGIGGVFPLGSLTHSVEEFGRPLQSSTDGSAVTYLGEDFYQPRLGSLNQYLSQRSSAGWITQNLTPGVPSTTTSAIEANLDVGFTADLSVGVVSVEGAFENYANLYTDNGGNLEPLLTAVPHDRTPDSFGYANHVGLPIERRLLFAGGNSGSVDASPFSHTIFEANDKLTADANDGGERANNLYEWSGGKLRLVNILPGQQTGDVNASFGVMHNDEYNAVVLPSLSRVISADGAKIFWTDENNNNLYAREDGTRTKQIDAAIGGGGQFQTASLDGSRVFFTKLDHLYEYSYSDDTTEDITSGGGVEGFIGASGDGSYIYFVSSNVLASGAAAGQPNLYLSHNKTLSFIATLSSADNEVPGLYGAPSPYGDWYRTFAGRTAGVSVNGRYLAFMSVASLTGYNNADAHLLGKDYELFSYDATTGRLTCASCNLDGNQPTSSTFLPAPVNGRYQQRYLSDNGRLFFSTVDSVLPQDTNGTSDVYEYESGHVSLISPGNTNDEAVFADASESGNDVFFTTRQQLVSADEDQIVDLYDARVGGRSEAPRPVPCLGEACRGLPEVPLLPSEVPISTIFSGGVSSSTVSAAKVAKRTVTKKPVKKRHRHKKHAKKPSGHSRGHGK